MGSLVKKTLNYFLGNGDLSFKASETERPNLMEFVSLEDSGEIYHFEGHVTSISDSCIVINRDIYCSPLEFPHLKNVELNALIRGVATRKGRHEAWRTTQAQLVEEEWDQIENKVNDNGRESGFSTISRDSRANFIPGVSKNLPSSVKSGFLYEGGSNYSQKGPNKSEIHQNHPIIQGNISDGQNCVQSEVMVSGKVDVYMGEVVSLNGDVLTLSDNERLQLCPNSCDFGLMEGDWVVCKVEETEENNMNNGTNFGTTANFEILGNLRRAKSLRAVRRKKVRGEITHQYNTHSIMNHEIYCPNYLIRAENVRYYDHVTADVIESKQGNLRWRAVSISHIPAIPQVRDLFSSVSLNPVLPKQSQDEQKVMISSNLRFPQINLGSRKIIYVNLSVCGATRVLKRVHIPQEEIQFTVEVERSLPLVVHPGQKVDIKLECKGKLIGEARAVCIFEFVDFQITRPISAYVTDPHMINLEPVSPFKPSPKFPQPLREGRGIIFGEKPFRPPTFSRISLPSAVVPESLWSAEGKQEILNAAPVLIDPLTLDNHREKFTVLLHLEEIELTKQMRRFDMPRVVFESHGEYLSLTVPGLAENRPSLLVGDTIEAYLPQDYETPETSSSKHYETTETVRNLSPRDYETRNSSPQSYENRNSSPHNYETARNSSPRDYGTRNSSPQDYETDETSSSTVYQGYIHQVLQSKVLIKFHPGFHNQYHGEDYAVRFFFNRTTLRRCHFALKFAMTQLGPDVLFPVKLKLQLPQVCYVDMEALPPRSRQLKIVQKPKKSANLSVAQCPNPSKDQKSKMSANLSVAQSSMEGVPPRSGPLKIDQKPKKSASLSVAQSPMEGVPPRSGQLKIVQGPKNSANLSVPQCSNPSKVQKSKMSANLSVPQCSNPSKESSNLSVSINPSKGGHRMEKESDIRENLDKLDKIQALTPIQKNSNQRRIKESLTPPRLPVVTRLFGVQHSSPSTCNSNDEEEMEKNKSSRLNSSHSSVNSSIDEEMEKQNNSQNKFLSGLNNSHSSVNSSSDEPEKPQNSRNKTSYRLKNSHSSVNSSNDEPEKPQNSRNKTSYRLNNSHSSVNSSSDEPENPQNSQNKTYHLKSSRSLFSSENSTKSLVNASNDSTKTSKMENSEILCSPLLKNEAVGKVNSGDLEGKEIKDAESNKMSGKIGEIDSKGDSTVMKNSSEKYNGSQNFNSKLLIPRVVELSYRRNVVVKEEKVNGSNEGTELKHTERMEGVRYRSPERMGPQKDLNSPESPNNPSLSQTPNPQKYLAQRESPDNRSLSQTPNPQKDLTPRENPISSLSQTPKSQNLNNNTENSSLISNSSKFLNSIEKSVPVTKRELDLEGKLGTGSSNEGKTTALKLEAVRSYSLENTKRHHLRKEIVNAELDPTELIKTEPRSETNEKLQIKYPVSERIPPLIRPRNQIKYRYPEIKYIIPVLPLKPNPNKNISSPVLKFFNKSLNQEQRLAVRRILQGTTRPLPYVIFGPPGTGKTVTLVEVSLQILTLMPASRILIVTPSNSASDLVAERLIESGNLNTTDLLRLNAYQRSEDSIPSALRPFCATGDRLDSGAVMRRVICATASTAGILYNKNLHNNHYTHVLVDEAGQLTEPETLLVMGLVNRTSGQIVLCGDPKQLGPVVMSRVARNYGLQNSLLHRLCQSVLYQAQENEKGWYYEPSLVTQLVQNYRSMPEILTVPSTLFYNNTLVPSANLKPLEYLLKWEELPRRFPVFFHGIVGENMQEGDSPSWFNPAEAFQVTRYTKSLINFGVKPKDIGIITPYRKQVDKINKLLGTFGVSSDVKVGSVEEFQGQERQVILISTVKSSVDILQCNLENQLGFVNCERRFNVAVTRAQGLLIMLGDPFLLTHDQSWNQMLSFCIKHGVYTGVSLDQWYSNAT